MNKPLPDESWPSYQAHSYIIKSQLYFPRSLSTIKHDSESFEDHYKVTVSTNNTIKEYNFTVPYYSYKKVNKCGQTCCSDSIKANEDCYQQIALKELIFVWEMTELKIKIVQDKDMKTYNVKGPLKIMSKFDPYFCLKDLTSGKFEFDNQQSDYIL
jgi:hypothetical protein